MILHSTAEPDSGAAKPTDSFTWTSPGAPVRINIRFGLILRLQTELNRQVEIGGVLLGHKGRDPATVDIRDCIRIPCENQLDGLYTLNISELERLRQTDSGLEEHTVHGSNLFCNWYPGLSVVGYFRTQSKDVLRLRDAEIELVRKRLPDPSSVALLIEASREQNEAGFFFLDPNTLIPFSFTNFPFDAGLLQRAMEHLVEPSARASEEAEEVPPEPEIIPAKAWRSDSLGLRTRLAEELVPTLASLSTLLLRARWVPSTRSLLPGAGAVRRWVFSAKNILAAGGVARRWVGGATRSLLAATGAVRRWVVSSARSLLAATGAVRRWVVASTESLLAATGVVRRWVSSTRNLLATLGAVLVLTALASLLLSKYGRPSSKGSVAAQAGVPFQLIVQAKGKGVDVRWDPQNTTLADAHEGRLVITAPQKRPKIVKLDPDQLASGHLFYRSSAKGLNFRLDVIDSSGKVDKESISASSSTPVGGSPTAARQLRPAGFTFTPPHASQVGNRPKHVVLKYDPPQSVPTASADAPSVRLGASRNDEESNPRPTVPNPVEPVVTTAVSAVPSVDQISVGAERQDITEKFGVPAFSTETIVRGHALETMVYGPDRAHTQTIISLKDGKVLSTSSR